MARNVLYYGDNLNILREYIADESVDLVYLDPPFKSNQDYNVLFKERDGTRSAAQVKAFKDTWQWDEESSRAYQEMVEHGPEQVANVLRAFRTFLGTNDMLAYLSMMAPRLVELRRVLKDTGSIYLHCDPTASHYLKLLMDAVFGLRNFRNEIIWRRDVAGKGAKRISGQWPRNADVILFYSKSSDWVFHQAYKPLSDKQARNYRYEDADGRRFKTVQLGDYSEDSIRRLEREGLIYVSRTGQRYKKYYLDEARSTIDTIWIDIPGFGTRTASSERLGYPTQKPEALLERIIQASSNEGDLVLDPFCGCGTTIAVAQRLNRQWIGIDVTCLAINLMRRRLEASFGDDVEFEVIGEPTTYSEAKQLAAENPYQFQWWALGLVGARPAVRRKGTDKGIDGRLLFHDDESGETKQVILSVKAGRVNVAHLRDLRGVIEREGAEIGCLICLQEPTKAMRTEAAAAGFYQSPLGDKMYPRMQILTIKELLEGKKLQLPETRVDVTFKKAPRARRARKQRSLGQNT